MMIKNCLECGIKFKGRIRNKFCSRICYWQNKKGAILSMEHRKRIGLTLFGHKVSRETKLKISASNRGKIRSLEARKKISEGNKGKKAWNQGLKGYMAGKNHYNWQGGITPKNKKIRDSLEMKIWRETIFKRDDYRCIGCGDNKGGNLQADHILPFSQFPRLRFDVNNGRILCAECHKLTETHGKKANNFSIEGRPVIHLTQ